MMSLSSASPFASTAACCCVSASSCRGNAFSGDPSKYAHTQVRPCNLMHSWDLCINSSQDRHLGCGLLHAQLLVLLLLLLHLFEAEELLALQLVQLALQQRQVAVMFSMLVGRQVTNDLKSTCWLNASIGPYNLCQVTIGCTMWCPGLAPSRSAGGGAP
jgi:hypothetical protein